MEIIRYNEEADEYEGTAVGTVTHNGEQFGKILTPGGMMDGTIYEMDPDGDNAVFVGEDEWAELPECIFGIDGTGSISLILGTVTPEEGEPSNWIMLVPFEFETVALNALQNDPEQQVKNVRSAFLKAPGEHKPYIMP